MKFNKDKYTPPFRVGRKQGKAVLDASGLEVVFMHDEKQAQEYCQYLNTASKVKTHIFDDLWLIIHPSGHEGRYFVGWEDAFGDCGADLLTEEEMHKKYPWIKDKSYQEELDKLK